MKHIYAPDEGDFFECSLCHGWFVQDKLNDNSHCIHCSEMNNEPLPSHYSRHKLHRVTTPIAQLGAKTLMECKEHKTAHRSVDDVRLWLREKHEEWTTQEHEAGEARQYRRQFPTNPHD
jgi:hypothetical protein